MAARHSSAGGQKAVRLDRGQDPERELLCLPQPLRRRDDAVERACACQCARRSGVRARHGEHITILDDWPKVVEVPPPPEANPKRAPEDKESVTASKPARDGKTVKAANKPALTQAKAESAAPPSPPPVAKEPEMDREAQFVTFLHEDACRRFGTVLGPDANAAHKNHFHLDMKKRRKGFCE
jgi:hypothetical protein